MIDHELREMEKRLVDGCDLCGMHWLIDPQQRELPDSVNALVRVPTILESLQTQKKEKKNEICPKPNLRKFGVERSGSVGTTRHM